VQHKPKITEFEDAGIYALICICCDKSYVANLTYH